jgi:hypothetical protein
VEITDPGMPPREEALATLEELREPRVESAQAARARWYRRTPLALVVVLTVVAGAAYFAWLVARAGF